MILDAVKNYPVTVGICADSKYALAAIVESLKGQTVYSEAYLSYLSGYQD